MRITRLHFLLLLPAVLGLAAGSLAATSARNPGDRIWDAFGTQGATAMKAKYKESPENGLIDQTLDVEIGDANPNAVLRVTVDGMHVGRLRTNGIGDGFMFRARLGVTPGPDGRPPVGQRVEEGSIIRVFNPTGTTDVSGVFHERP